MNALRKKWMDALGAPTGGGGTGRATLTATLSHADLDGEWYLQETGGGRHQRVLMLFPKGLTAPVPAVAVPFYFPEGMLGYDPATGEALPRFSGIEMMLHLVRRGYAAVSADAYHLSYIDSTKDRLDFTRWQDAANALRADHPNYSGMGKLTDDTRLLIDLLAADPRVDSTRIGIAGHSLGGKMAFYAGCLDPRVRAILASDFGIGWHQTNWQADWYWGSARDRLAAEGFDHAELLTLSGTPLCLIAGQYDTEESRRTVMRAEGYGEGSPLFKFINHATGHKPPPWALEEGYAFLDTWLK